ncbi:MAG: hypothetical protein J5746_04105, partial [Victivallales bacterium]|nr:hypothetical protein [Victivallales bacterium]
MSSSDGFSATDIAVAPRALFLNARSTNLARNGNSNSMPLVRRRGRRRYYNQPFGSGFTVKWGRATISWQ